MVRVLKTRYILLLHDTSSSNRVVNFTKIACSYKDYVKLIIFSRVTGGAAQYGIPDSFKIGYKEGVNIIVLQDIEDAVELFKETPKIQFTRRYGVEFKSLKDDILNNISSNEVMLMFSGSDVGFSENEVLKDAVKIYPKGIARELPPESYLSIFMHLVASGI